MTAIVNPDATNERANDLLASGLNGLKLLLVALNPPSDATLEVHFINTLHIAELLNAATASPSSPSQVFRIRGGHRLPAGPATGQVHVNAVAAGPTPASLSLTVSPIGDYSTYTLELSFDPNQIDPFFASLPFKFRPGCFTNDCNPPATANRLRSPSPVIDYLAKDYDSFRHTLIAAMMARVPGWQVTSEADFDQVLIDLFAAAADELSDYQDRVMNEAYLATARNRVSLARHARLVDYHIHQGQQSSTWLALLLDPGITPFTLNQDLLAWAGHPDAPASWVNFASREHRLPIAEKALLDPLFNRFLLYTWSHSQPALAAGSTTADLVPDLPASGQVEAERVRDRINDGTLKALLLEEKRNPRTGREAGRDPRKRQFLHLKPDADALRDPLTGIWLVRVRWEDADALKFAYSFTTFCNGHPVDGVSAFHGNLLRVHQGLPVLTHFYEPGTTLPADDANEKHRYFERYERYGKSRGVLCRLPLGPLAYLPTRVGGEVPPQSSLYVELELPGAGLDLWDEVISLVHSDDSPEDGDHFAVETDERGRSLLRFGDGTNGRTVPDGAVIHCEYQVGDGPSGNVGRDAVTQFQPLAAPLDTAIVSVWNPFDVTDGLGPEPPEKVLRNAPEAYRARQLRAITLADYRRRAEEVPGVSRAVAEYAWTGSWRTVRIVIDPEGSTTLAPALRDDVEAHLESVRLIGEDLEIRPPRFVPLAIEVAVCVSPDVWPGDLRAVLEQEFSDTYTSDGRPGFFHPDAWTFGQPLHRSQIAGRLHAVAGVDHILAILLRRFDQPTPGPPDPERLDFGPDEILLVHNDPDHLERGFIRFALQGGRQ